MIRRGRRRHLADLESRLIWILGSPRSGSTWLLNLLARDRRVIKIEEPTIGVHLAPLMLELASVRPERMPPELLRINDARAELPSYFFSSRYREVWRPLVRDLLLGRLGAEVSDTARGSGISKPLAVIKEPDGSQGADVVMSALPRSRLLFLLRDGRDVIDSELDAFRAGGWAAALLPGFEGVDDHRLEFVTARAHAWLCRTSAVERAYEQHAPGLRMRVRYEDLLTDPAGVLARLVDWVGLDLDREAIESAVADTDFSRIDPGKRGAGRFARAATPGLWRQNLGTEEQRLIEEIVGPTLRRLGYA